MNGVGEACYPFHQWQELAAEINKDIFQNQKGEGNGNKWIREI